MGDAAEANFEERRRQNGRKGDAVVAEKWNEEIDEKDKKLTILPARTLRKEETPEAQINQFS